jgi:hypothetical protein
LRAEEKSKKPNQEIEQKEEKESKSSQPHPPKSRNANKVAHLALETRLIRLAAEFLSLEYQYLSKCREEIYSLKESFIKKRKKEQTFNSKHLMRFLDKNLAHVAWYRPQITPVLDEWRKKLFDRSLPTDNRVFRASHSQLRTQRLERILKKKWQRFLDISTSISLSPHIQRIVTYFHFRSDPKMMIYHTNHSKANTGKNVNNSSQAAQSNVDSFDSEYRYMIVLLNVDISMIKLICQTIIETLQLVGVPGVNGSLDNNLLIIQSDQESTENFSFLDQKAIIDKRSQKDIILESSLSDIQTIENSSTPNETIHIPDINKRLRLSASLERNMITKAVSVNHEEDYLLVDLGEVCIQAFASAESQKFQKYLEHLSSFACAVPVKAYYKLAPVPLNRFNAVLNT